MASSLFGALLGLYRKARRLRPERENYSYVQIQDSLNLRQLGNSGQLGNSRSFPGCISKLSSVCVLSNVLGHLVEFHRFFEAASFDSVEQPQSADGDDLSGVFSKVEADLKE